MVVNNIVSLFSPLCDDVVHQSQSPYSFQLAEEEMIAVNCPPSDLKVRLCGSMFTKSLCPESSLHDKCVEIEMAAMPNISMAFFFIIRKLKI